MALARALFRNSDVIVLDEPTASLDPKSEVDIMENLFHSTLEQAIIFITHRLGAASLADEIVVLKEGKVIERGNHDELLNSGGEYSRMYQLQSKWYQKSNQAGATL